MIKAVIFDLDNTLYSYDANHAYGMEALEGYCRETFGITEEETQEYYRKAGYIMANRIGTDTAALHSRMLRLQCMMELLKKPLFPHVQKMYHIYWDAFLQHIEPNPGFLDFLMELRKRKIRIGIGTDMTAYIQYKKLEAIGAEVYIDFMVTSEEAGVEKPHYHLFELCVEKAGVRVEECAFIGDNVKKDIEGAWESGLRGIWYTQEKEPTERRYFPILRSFTGINVDDFLAQQ